MASCGGAARLHYQDARSGVFVLEGDRDKAMEDAQKKMAAHCGPGAYRIVKQETVVVGREQYTNTYQDYEEDRARQRNTDSASASDTQTDYAETNTTDVAVDSTAASGPGHDSQSTAVSAESTTSGFEDTSTTDTASTREDEAETARGSARSSTVTGERDVNEFRVHYICVQP